MLRQFINHDYRLRNVGLVGTRRSLRETGVNAELGLPLLVPQRGSVDVEERNLGSWRELFLSQAGGSAPSDPFVETEWAYLLFREAIDNPRATDAQTLVDEAMGILDELIGRHSRLDSYPYHVLGSQGLSWSRRGIGKSHAKGQYLSRLKDIVLAGMEKHPKERQLSKLQKDIEREYLMIAVGNRD